MTEGITQLNRLPHPHFLVPMCIIYNCLVTQGFFCFLVFGKILVGLESVLIDVIFFNMVFKYFIEIDLSIFNYIYFKFFPFLVYVLFSSVENGKLLLL